MDQTSRRAWVCSISFFFLMIPRPTRSTLFPYTTLFRSAIANHCVTGIALAPRARGSRFAKERSMRRVGTVLLAVVCAAAAGCDQKLSTLAGPTPGLEPTFSSVQSQIFETTDVAGRQACVNCHSNVGRTPSGGLNLAHDSAYDQIVNVPRARTAGAIRVIPR